MMTKLTLFLLLIVCLAVALVSSEPLRDRRDVETTTAHFVPKIHVPLKPGRPRPLILPLSTPPPINQH